MYRGFPKKEIQPNSHKERHPKTQSKNRNSKSVKSSCLPDKALWTRQKGWHSLNITESSYPPPRKHLHKLQQQQAGPCLGHWTALLGLGMNFKLAELCTESINVTACLTTEVLGNFSLKHKCCKAVINRNSKTVSQVHELLPKKIIPSPEMKIFP